LLALVLRKKDTLARRFEDTQSGAGYRSSIFNREKPRKANALAID
jgi:hypothetical protein